MKLMKELEEEIIKQEFYHRCKEHYKGCAQCDFWEKFDWIKKDLKELEGEDGK